jgi:hypothetical protein
MSTTTTALIILLVGLVGLEISGIWLIRLGRRGSRPLYQTLGQIVCWGGLLLLIAGLIGFIAAAES